MKFKHLIPSSSSSSSSSSLSTIIGFKRLRPLPKTVTSLDLETLNSPTSKCPQVQTIQDISPSGGMRWNPTQEQIRMLEALYCSGMRTPSAEQIDRITAELGRHGRIEGKNVFYWFQNHKARERQRQKRSAALLTLRSTPPPDPIMSLFSAYKEEKEPKEYSDGSCKRKCRSWNSDELQEVELELEDNSSDGTTLELFPLKPERGR